MKQPDGFLEGFKPNGTPHTKWMTLVLVGWISLVMIAWMFGPDIVPGPAKVFKSAVDLYRTRNLFGELFTTWWVLGKAMLWTIGVSLAITYSSVIPYLRAPNILVTLLRFLGLTGLTYFIFRAFGVTESAKVFMLGFGMSTWFVTTMSKIVAEIKDDRYDHARSLGWSEWHVTSEVVVLGTAHQAFETMRQIFAMAFMMVTFVEGLVRSQGGIGVMMLNEDKHFVFEDMIAIITVLLIVALIQDSVLSLFGRQLFPYAFSATERK